MLAQDVSNAGSQAFWPVTVTGWVALIGLLGSVMGLVYTWIRGLAHLNGLGDKQNAMAAQLTALATIVAKLERHAEIADHDQRVLTEKVGEARKSAEQCHDDNDQMRAQIVGAINEMRGEMNNQLGALRERVKALEVEMQIRNRGGRDVRHGDER